MSVLLGSTAITLVLLELALRATGLAVPTYSHGDPELGWRPAAQAPAGWMDACVDYAAGKTVQIRRNADGARVTEPEGEAAAGERLHIVVSGDSHTELCTPNELTHFGVLEQELGYAGLPARVLGFGAGKYSPLQAYLASRTLLGRHDREVLVLNLYSGNDFMDMLRVDDRPHLVAEGTGYRIAPPAWYLWDAPDRTRSIRVLALAEAGLEKLGISSTLARVRHLRAAAGDPPPGAWSTLRYVMDVWRGRSPETGYPDAFVAQFLNQQIFMHHFPGTREEALSRLRYLLRTIRAEQPHTLLVLTVIPSYQLVYQDSVNEALASVLSRLPAEGEATFEAALVGELSAIATENDWLFVDVLDELRAIRSDVQLYNTFDYHIEPVASRIIGEAQADTILSAWSRRPPTAETPPAGH